MKVQLLTSQMPKEWYQAGERPIFLVDVLDETGPSPMSVGFARYGAGAQNDGTMSYDEVLIITRGCSAWWWRARRPRRGPRRTPATSTCSTR